MKYKAKTTVDRNQTVKIRLYLLQKYSVCEALIYQVILDNGGILVSTPMELSKRIKIFSNINVSKAVLFLKKEGVLKTEDLGNNRRRYTLLDVDNLVDKEYMATKEFRKGKIKERFDRLPESVRERVLAIRRIKEEKISENFAD